MKNSHSSKCMEKEITMFNLKRAKRCAIIFSAFFFFFTNISEGEYSPSYSHDNEVKTYHKNWMTLLRDTILLSDLSIPGTHETMSLYWGDAVQCQSLSLKNQLEAGIRALDIRCRHVGDSFNIYHGIANQKATFIEVLAYVIEFLKSNRGETVLMRIQETSDPESTTRSFEATLSKKYLTPLNKFFWKYSSNNPSLAEMRGKIVILQEFSSADNTKYGIPWDSFNIQDNYVLENNWHLYNKWIDVKTQLQRANTKERTDRYINFLSGSKGSFPYFVASGHSSPGTSAPQLSTGVSSLSDKYPDFERYIGSILFIGTNFLTYDRLGSMFSKQVGIIFADFPGPGLIDRIIALNDRMKK